MPGSITEAIILAGGLGTRLRSAVPDLPKCMAPVNGVPFIAYVVNHFQTQGIENFIFALGYKSEAFESFLRSSLPSGNYALSIENEPLGTGGAVRLACSKTRQPDVIVANGDTLFRIRVGELAAFHAQKNAACTLALKPMHDFNRYGVIELNEDDSIKSFNEKKYYASGLINGGLYMLDVPHFLQHPFPGKFSFETVYLEKFYTKGRMYGLVQDEYFIDIGIPEDYARAQKELIV